MFAHDRPELRGSLTARNDQERLRQAKKVDWYIVGHRMKLSTALPNYQCSITSGKRASQ
ncbi:MAG: hypothetical protein QOH70_2058 [Blastocatellia bacterium]|jgi:hypothetical protein|nr:hypothetical protein [Blastocatellia bacterium]